MLPTHEVATATVLVVSPSMNHSLSGILEGGSCPLVVLHSPDCGRALPQLTASMISVVICDALLSDGSWKDLLAYIGQVGAPSVLVVTSRLADESLWAEVLNLGGYDVLAQPFDREEVTRVVRSAVRASSDPRRRRLA
jgi:DNA-binding response OmpR family regulator